MPFDSTPRIFVRLMVEAARELGSHLGDGHLQPRAHIRRTADYGQAILTVGRHLAQRQLVRIGMAAALEDLAHDDPAEGRRDGRDRLDLEPGEREPLREIRGGLVSGVNSFSQE